MGETQSVPGEPQSDLKAQSLPWEPPSLRGGNNAFSKSNHPLEENRRQVVLIGADIRCPRPEGRQGCGGQRGPLPAAERAWSEDPGMRTSYLQLPGAGLHPLPQAMTFPTSPSDRCFGLRSVPDKLLKILTPAGGQGCGSLAEKWHCYPSTEDTCPLSASLVLSALSSLTQAPHARKVSKGTEAKKGSKALCIGPESSAQVWQSLPL